jgi:hypothetical protein
MSDSHEIFSAADDRALAAAAKARADALRTRPAPKPESDIPDIPNGRDGGAALSAPKGRPFLDPPKPAPAPKNPKTWAETCPTCIKVGENLVELSGKHGDLALGIGVTGLGVGATGVGLLGPAEYLEGTATAVGFLSMAEGALGEALQGHPILGTAMVAVDHYGGKYAEEAVEASRTAIPEAFGAAGTWLHGLNPGISTEVANAAGDTIAVHTAHVLERVPVHELGGLVLGDSTLGAAKELAKTVAYGPPAEQKPSDRK